MFQSNPNPPTRGFWASIDLLLTFLILISILMPLLPYSIWTLHHRQEWAADQQRLSLALVHAHSFYALDGVPVYSKQSAYSQAAALPPLSDLSANFTKSGYYDAARAAEAELRVSKLLSKYGLDFELQPSTFSVLPSHPNQICVHRLMLDASANPFPIHLCLWPAPSP